MNPMPAAAARAFPFGRAVALHSLGWLVAANLIGIWLGISLLWPAVGNLLAPFTYGRWSPLHLDWQLYGWCALPMVGALLAWCLDPAHPNVRGHAAVAMGAWSAALALGGVAWLGGTVSGKLFLDWHGWTRWTLPAAMHLLWALLATHTAWRWRRMDAAGRRLRAGILALLLAVPAVLYFTTRRDVYHPINPDSGGATGAAVLGSTLGVVTIFFLVPVFVGVAARRRIAPFWWALFASWLVFGFLDRGNVSHHVPVTIVALGTLLAWIPLLPLFWRWHEWPGAALPWVRAAGGWWAVLVFTGWLSYLPGISEALKFSHALVGHAHLAMAGLLTSVNGAILVVLSGRRAPRGVFWTWQLGCIVYVTSMIVLGLTEIAHADALFRSEPWTQAILGTRLAGGSAMAIASVRWLAGYFRP